LPKENSMRSRLPEAAAAIVGRGFHRAGLDLFAAIRPAGQRGRAAAVLAGAAVVLLSLPAQAADTLPLSELARPGRVLMLRHATAPGVGDPPEFKLRDCTTQRNLDAVGRAQAAELGARLARAGVTQAKVYSSQWCRCLETARLLKLGAPIELPALNSFFGRSQDREPNLAALRRFLAELPVTGPPVILVTHQVTISGITGEGTASGEGHLLQLNGSGAPKVLGRIEAN